MNNKYAGVEVTLLNRDDGSEQKHHCYPATEILLISKGGLPTYHLVVNEDGFWGLAHE